MTSPEITMATAPENNVVVQAAAGTGKTYLLTSRIIRLLLAGTPPGAILAVTFTRKAAGEIRQRVVQRLLDMAGMDETRLRRILESLGAQTDPATIHRARDLYEVVLNAMPALRAVTFHAFCQDILRRFPLEADVPPGFTLLDATHELEQQAWHALDAEITSNPAKPLALAMDLLLRDGGGYDSTRQTLMAFFTHRSDWWAYTENQAIPAQYAADQLQNVLEVTPGKDPVAGFLGVREIFDLLGRYAHLLAKHATATNEKHAANLIRALTPDAPTAQAFALVSEALLTRDLTPRVMRASKTLTKQLGDRAAQELFALHRELTQRVLAVHEQISRHKSWKLSRAWYLCGQRLIDHYQRLKLERAALDFADLEWKTYQLLNRGQHAEWVQYKLDQRIDHLLVDEFQDTNPTQWQLLLPLLQEITAGDPHRSRSIFLVGDEKQSIYRFRRADPELFDAARKWLTQHAGAHTVSQHASWRSSPAVIRFINLIFDRKAESISELPYSLPGFQRHATHLETTWGRVELLPIVSKRESTQSPTALRNPLHSPRLIDEDLRHQEEADLVAGRIHALIGTPITAMDPVSGETIHRPLTPGDILILLRDRLYAQTYEDALRRAGIPYLGSGRGLLLSRLEVRDLIHLLKLLCTPFDDLALASVLRSPMFAATEADLMQLAVQVGASSWYERLLRLTTMPDSPLGRAQRLLPQWQRRVDRVPIHDLLDRIYAEADMIGRYVASAPAHLQGRVAASLTRMLELALEADSGRYPSVMHFLENLEALTSDESEAIGASFGAAQQRVRLLTIHGAKGLEAPVVFLVDSARDPGKRDRGARALIDWPVSAPKPVHFQLCPRREELDAVSRYLQQQRERAARREETNLLYVALTRARQILYISGCEPARGERGWYGYLEERLRLAEASGAAADAGAVLEHRYSADGNKIHNTTAVLTYGQTPAVTDTSAAAPARQLAIDDALRTPLMLAPARPENRPSDLAGDDDAADDDIVSASERVRARRRGTVLHRMLELLTSSISRAEARARAWHEYGSLVDETVLDVAWREACAVVDHEPFQFLFDARHYEHARNELPLLYQDKSGLVHGVIDRMVLAGDELILVDYKTHPNATAANVQTLAQSYVRQMQLYRDGIQRLWPNKRIRRLLLFTGCRETVEIEQ